MDVTRATLRVEITGLPAAGPRMGIRELLTGSPLQALGLEAKGFAYSQRGGMSLSYGSDAWAVLKGLSRPTSRDYATVRTELSSALAVCLNTVTNAFPEAELVIERETDEGEYEREPEHPALMLVERPNPYMHGAEILAAIVRDLMTSASGSAYLVKRRGPFELWPVHSSMMRPVWPESGDEFISGYEITIDGATRHLDPRDVVHFRNDIDPMPPSYGRCGIPYLPPIMQDLYIDTAAADFTAAIMRNMGMPGAIISPKALVDGRSVTLSSEVRDQFAADYQARFTGAGRGRALVTGNPIDVHQLGFEPEKMALRDIRKIAEERVAAIYNIPAIIAGFGAGLDRATYANYQEATKAFWTGCIIPLQRRIARTLTDQLLNVDFSRSGEYFEFEHDHIEALQENETEKRDRDRADFAAGLLTHHQAVERLGIEAEGEDWMVLPVSVTAYPVSMMPTAPEPAPMPEPQPEPPMPKAERKAEPDIGPALNWTDEQIEAEAIVTDEDIAEAEATIRERSPMLADLLESERTRKSIEVRDVPGVVLTFDTKATYRWNPRTRRYYGANGRIVSKATVDGAMDAAVDASREVMAGYADALISGEMSLVDYQLAMKAEIKSMHLASIATTRGGWKNLSARERGQAAKQIQEQYKYLNRSCLAFENGGRAIDGRIRSSSMMYASSARTAYGEADYDAAKDAAEAAPDTHQERWIRHASDSCKGCVTQASKGWQPLGTLPEIGTQTCLTNCKCSKSVRKRPRQKPRI